MSKVICDICGTTFPETASQCPICGSAKASSAQTAADEQPGMEAEGYTYTKGGHFSKSNVRKRTKTGKTAERRPARSNNTRNRNEEKEPANWSMVVVVLLLLAIVAVVIYILVRVLGPSGLPGKNTEPNQTQSTQSTGESTVPEIPCTGLELSNTVIALENLGDMWLLSATPAPADTTDEVTMTSSDENVAVVLENGNIKAVGSGEATITVTCGEVTAQCKVICTFENPSQPSGGTDASQPTEPSVPAIEFEFNTRFEDNGVPEVTLTKKGETWKAYKPSLPISPQEIQWTSDKPDVCTVVNGIVTAVSPGKAHIYASYNGQPFKALVRCNWTEEPTEPTEPSDPTEPSQPPVEPTEPSAPAATISHTDVTIAVGESFYLRLKDASGNNLTVNWTAGADIVTIDGNKITGAKAGTNGGLARTSVSTTYNGVTYACTIYVKPAN